MRTLWVTTKLLWPARDGGRLLMSLTLEALLAAGVDVHLVAPLSAEDDVGAIPETLADRVTAVPRSLDLPLPRAFRALLSPEPLAVAIHRDRRVLGAVAHALRQHRFDVVHAEQLQAWPQCAPARACGIPILLRCQNVESDLLRDRQDLVFKALRTWEARRLARYEATAIGCADAVAALTVADAARLARLPGANGAGAAQGPKIYTVPAPFPETLPSSEKPLEGHPAVVLLGSAWHINDDGLAWFVSAVWPRIRSLRPNAVLHVFGPKLKKPHNADAGIRWPGPPADSRVAFAPRSIFVVPLRYASGVRMRILEAWARHVPVVATSAAVRGMNVEPGREALIGDDAEALAACVCTLADNPVLAERLCDEGHAHLQRDHAPARIATQLIGLYEGLQRNSSSR